VSIVAVYGAAGHTDSSAAAAGEAADQVAADRQAPRLIAIAATAFPANARGGKALDPPIAATIGP